jgi:hypothetical protein
MAPARLTWEMKLRRPRWSPGVVGTGIILAPLRANQLGLALAAVVAAPALVAHEFVHDGPVLLGYFVAGLYRTVSLDNMSRVPTRDDGHQASGP